MSATVSRYRQDTLLSPLVAGAGLDAGAALRATVRQIGDLLQEFRREGLAHCTHRPKRLRVWGARSLSAANACQSSILFQHARAMNADRS